MPSKRPSSRPSPACQTDRCVSSLSSHSKAQICLALFLWLAWPSPRNRDPQGCVSYCSPPASLWERLSPIPLHRIFSARVLLYRIAYNVPLSDCRLLFCPHLVYQLRPLLRGVRPWLRSQLAIRLSYPTSYDATVCSYSLYRALMSHTKHKSASNRPPQPSRSL